MTSLTTRLPHTLAQLNLWQKAVAVLVGSWVLAASAQIAVPMIPVPMTMQSFAVVLIGAVCGWRMAGATVVAYLAQSFAGAPFLAAGAGGPLPFVGPTAGYLFAFVPAAMLVGLAAERGLTRGLVAAFAVMWAGHMLIFAGGVGVLAAFVGFDRAIEAGLVPFVFGSVIKCGLAAVALRALSGRAAR